MQQHEQTNNYNLNSLLNDNDNNYISAINSPIPSFSSSLLSNHSNELFSSSFSQSLTMSANSINPQTNNNESMSITTLSPKQDDNSNPMNQSTSISSPIPSSLMNIPQTIHNTNQSSTSNDNINPIINSTEQTRWYRMIAINFECANPNCSVNVSKGKSIWRYMDMNVIVSIGKPLNMNDGFYVSEDQVSEHYRLVRVYLWDHMRKHADCLDYCVQNGYIVAPPKHIQTCERRMNEDTKLGVKRENKDMKRRGRREDAPNNKHHNNSVNSYSPHSSHESVRSRSPARTEHHHHNNSSISTNSSPSLNSFGLNQQSRPNILVPLPSINDPLLSIDVLHSGGCSHGNVGTCFRCEVARNQDIQSRMWDTVESTYRKVTFMLDMMHVSPEKFKEAWKEHKEKYNRACAADDNNSFMANSSSDEELGQMKQLLSDIKSVTQSTTNMLMEEKGESEKSELIWQVDGLDHKMIQLWDDHSFSAFSIAPVHYHADVDPVVYEEEEREREKLFNNLVYDTLSKRRRGLLLSESSLLPNPVFSLRHFPANCFATYGHAIVRGDEVSVQCAEDINVQIKNYGSISNKNEQAMITGNVNMVKLATSTKYKWDVANVRKKLKNLVVRKLKDWLPMNEGKFVDELKIVNFQWLSGKPGDGLQSRHRDTRNNKDISVLLYLSDLNSSTKMSNQHLSKHANVDDAEEDLQECDGVWHNSNFSAIPVRKGDMCIFRSNTVHRGVQNNYDTDRELVFMLLSANKYTDYELDKQIMVWNDRASTYGDESNEFAAALIECTDQKPRIHHTEEENKSFEALILKKVVQLYPEGLLAKSGVVGTDTIPSNQYSMESEHEQLGLTDEDLQPVGKKKVKAIKPVKRKKYKIPPSKNPFIYHH